MTCSIISNVDGYVADELKIQIPMAWHFSLTEVLQYPRHWILCLSSAGQTKPVVKSELETTTISRRYLNIVWMVHGDFLVRRYRKLTIHVTLQTGLGQKKYNITILCSFLYNFFPIERISIYWLCCIHVV